MHGKRDFYVSDDCRTKGRAINRMSYCLLLLLTRQKREQLGLKIRMKRRLAEISCGKVVKPVLIFIPTGA